VRRPSQDSFLPPIFIQAFGAVIVTAITVAGLLGKGNPTILLAVLGVAAGFVLLGGFYERIKHDMVKAMQPPEDSGGGP
jgi:hypothetical protein